MDYAQARTKMVENQLRPNGIDDPSVLRAMAETPRELFLPKKLHGVAYADEDLPLPDGHFMIEPLAFARLLQAAEIDAEDVVLVVGCGTGYVAAVVAKLAATVIVLQDDREASLRIQPLLDQLGADNVVTTVVASGPLAGDPEQAPFDTIVVIGALSGIPQALVDQLGENGRLVAVVGQGRIGKGIVLTKIRGVAAKRVLFDARTPDFVGIEKTPEFVF